MDRPTVIYCAFRLADDQPECGQPRDVKQGGNIPRYCVEHADHVVRGKLLRAYRDGVIESLAKGEPPLDQDSGVPVEGEQESGEAEEAPRVCRARSCSIPLSAEWVQVFCPGHWRLLSTEAQGDLVNSKADWDLQENAVLHALQQISRVEG